MALDYYATQISDHLGKTKEGYLLAPGVCLARTGWQKYLTSELPENAADLGVDMDDPRASVDVYRPESEVFDPVAIASMEGKPICDGHPPGDQFVTPENIRDLQMGHVQNVRKGDEPLESGDWPLLGDLVITTEPLLSDVEHGRKRELSAGYEYVLDKDSNGHLIQTAIAHNHCAVVEKARAGIEARIQDSLPEDLGDGKQGRAGTARTVDAASGTPAPATPAGSGPTGVTQVGKEKSKMSWKAIFGRGLQARARDEGVDPEDLTEEVEQALGEKNEPPAAPPVKDAAPPAAPPVVEERRLPAAEDHRADDFRSRMHDALEEMLKGKERQPEKAEDVDLDALKELLSQFFSEEEGEAAHQDAAPEGEEGEILPVEEEAEPLAADCYAPARAADRFISESGRRPARGHDDLDALRPFIAKCGDASLKRAFNQRVAMRRTPGASGGSYGAFASAARARAADAEQPRGYQQPKLEQEMQAAADRRRQGINTQEVK